MGVSVHFKLGQRWLQAARKPSVLGGGMLERVRSTTLGLLGVTTAVGLAMVALALNQSWPLIADSPLPLAQPQHQAVGRATIAARAIASAPDPSDAPAARSTVGPAHRTTSDDRRSSTQAPAGGTSPTGSAELVVAPSAPAPPQGDAPSSDGTPNPTTQPSPAEEKASAPPASVPVADAPPAAPAAPPAVESTPPASSAEAPVESSDDEWDEDEDDWDGDEDEDDWGDHGWGGHDNGHHWSGGRRNR